MIGERQTSIARVRLRPRYSWAAWLDLHPHELVAGLDFHQPPTAMRNTLLDHARRHDGLRVRTSVCGQTLKVLALQPSAAADQPPMVDCGDAP